MGDRWKQNRLLREIRGIGKNICRTIGRKPENQLGNEPEKENKVTYMEYAQVKKRSQKFKNESIQKLPFSLESNIKLQKEMVPECRAADMYYEKKGESGKYSFAYPLIVQNPYGLVPLSALMIFRTSEPCRIRYTVKGKTAGTDFVNEGNELRTKHRIPVLGLYAGTENVVVLERLDENGELIEKKEFPIVTPALPERLEHCVVKKKETVESAYPFKFIFGGDSKYPYAFDSNGDIRYFLKRTPKPYGLFFLNNGHFLFSEKDILMPSFANPHAVKNLEMDYLGRVHRIYQVENGIHHDVCEMENGNFIAAYSTLAEGNEDALAEIDRKTGEVIKIFRFSDVLDETYQTAKDWAHVNSVCYQPETHTVVACLRNVHSVLKIHWQTGKLEWILCHPDFWENTPMKSKVLRPKEGMKWFYQAHAAYLLPGQTDEEGNPLLMIYDNHWHKRRPVPFFDQDVKSYVRIYAINETEKTVSLWKNYACDKSKIRSNGLLKGSRAFAMSGYLEPELEGFQGEINEYDAETCELLNQYMIVNSFYRAYGFTPDYDILSRKMESTEDYRLGSYRKPVLLKDCGLDFSQSKSMEEKTGEGNNLYFKGTKKERKKQWKAYLASENAEQSMVEEDVSNIEFSITEDSLYIEAVDHLIQKIYFVDRETVYQADYTDTVQVTPELFGRMVYQLAVPFTDFMPGNYNIYLLCGDILYDSGKYIKLSQ